MLSNKYELVGYDSVPLHCWKYKNGFWKGPEFPASWLSLFSTFDSSFSFPSLVSQTPLTSSTPHPHYFHKHHGCTLFRIKPGPFHDFVQISSMKPNLLSQPPHEPRSVTFPPLKKWARSHRFLLRGTLASSSPDHQGETEQQKRRSFTPTTAAQKDSHPCSL